MQFASFVAIRDLLVPISNDTNQVNRRKPLDFYTRHRYKPRFSFFASLRSQFNAKAQRRRDAKGDICRHVFRVVVHPTDTLQKSSVCGGAKYRPCQATGAHTTRSSTVEFHARPPVRPALDVHRNRKRCRVAVRILDMHGKRGYIATKPHRTDPK